MINDILEWFNREGMMEVDTDLTREDCSFVDCEKCLYGNTCDSSVKVKQ